MPAFPLWQVFLPILLAAAAPSACRAIFFNDPILIPSLECFFKFSLLGFNPSNLDRYDTYFRNDSIMEVAQTGQYLGPEGIKEYIRFGYGVFSPYLATGPTDGQTPHIPHQLPGLRGWTVHLAGDFSLAVFPGSQLYQLEHHVPCPHHLQSLL